MIFNISPLPLLEWVSTCFANLFFAEQLLHNRGSDSGRYMYLKKAFADEISCMEVQGFFRVEIRNPSEPKTSFTVSFSQDFREDLAGTGVESLVDPIEES